MNPDPLHPEPLPFKQFTFEQVLFGQHALFALIQVQAKGKAGLFDQELFCSGFTLATDDKWYWISAGHVVTYLREAEQAGYTIGDSRFLDYGIKLQQAFPAYITLEAIDHIDDSDWFGADYAIFELNSLTQRNMIAGGATPVPMTRIATMGETFDRYFLVGCPTEWKQSEGDTIAFPLTTIYLERLENDLRGSVPRLVFDITKNAVTCNHKPMESIEGMSGGAIYGTRTCEDGTPAYALVGVQSTVLHGKAYACPASLLKNYLMGVAPDQMLSI
jgi:hypothetical protein